MSCSFCFPAAQWNLFLQDGIILPFGCYASPALFKGNYCYCLMYLLHFFLNIIIIHVIIIKFFIIYKMYIPGIYCSNFFIQMMHLKRNTFYLCVSYHVFHFVFCFAPTFTFTYQTSQFLAL